MINWAHDIVIVLISTGLATLFAGGGWLYRWWRDRKNMRLLVALEIIDNLTQLGTFVETLKALYPDYRRSAALYLDQASNYYIPQWQRSRWDTVSPGVFSPKELYKIGRWYHQLDFILESLNYICSQSALRRQLGEKYPGTQQEHIDFIVGKMAMIEALAESELRGGPPFTDKQLEKVSEEARKQFEALTQGQEGSES